MNREDIIRMAREAGMNLTPAQFSGVLEDEIDEFQLERFAELVRADEREACAELVESLPCDCCWPKDSISIAEDFADAIRFRGTP